MNGQRRRYSTGLPFLDRRIDGGITAGSLLALVAPPQSQSELLLRQLVQTRKTAFVSTIRSEPEVRRWAEAGATPPQDLTVLECGPETLLGEFTAVEDRLPPESFVVVGQMNGLEDAPRETYREFLAEFSAVLDRTDSVGIAHCPDTSPTPARRGLTLTRADQVWQLELLSLSREIKNRLLVTKSRYSRALREPIDIIMTDRIQVDTSRRIA